MQKLLSKGLVALPRWKRFSIHLRRASLAYDIPYTTALTRSLSLYLTKKFSLREILGYGLFVPSMASEFPLLISKENSLGALGKLNPQHLQHLTENKDEFYKICVGHHFPVPETYGWTRDGKRFTAADSLVGDEADWSDYINTHLPVDFIVKDRAGAYGSGFAAYHRRDSKFLATGKTDELDLRRLISVVSPVQGGADTIIQKRLFDDPTLSELSGRRGLQTMRVTTLLEEGGRVSILFYMVKILASDQESDNFSMGTSGNLIAFGDREKGILRGAITPHQCGSGMSRIANHPRTGLVFDGFRLPYWQEAIDLVKTAQRKFSMLPTLGWDIALTADGPIIIEANSRWDPPLYAPFIMRQTDWHRIFARHD
jgi:hypothetical protein